MFLGDNGSVLNVKPEPVKPKARKEEKLTTERGRYIYDLAWEAALREKLCSNL